ncbi:xanthine dehydrogenase family protein molybdopterin-binding subunit [Myxococcota bacterium]|nr:xanthine dehydrogenase family protein molybdopterin-binding subunit [Myxococcota bacterium]
MKKSGLDQGIPRPDAVAKATGRSLYHADRVFPKMLYGVIVGSKVACGTITRLNVEKARAMPGVRAVLTHENLDANNRIGLIFDDQTLLCSDTVRMAGDRVALIAADSIHEAKRAARAVEVEITKSPGVYDVRTALDADSPLVHPSGNCFKEFHVRRGDFDQEVINADIVLDEEFVIGGQEHAYLETQGTTAVPQPDGSYEVYSTTQCPFYIRGRVSRMLGVAHNQIRVIQTVTGGAFGGKEDYPDEPAMCAVALAKATGRPVQIVFPRDFDMQVTTKRHPMVIRHKLFAEKTGKIMGVKVEILVDSGAYAGLSTVVAERANISAVGPYDIDNIEVTTKVIYTNNLFGGPYRGFGAPQVSAAHEGQMDRLAALLGKDPMEIRRLNGVSDSTPHFASGETLAQPHLYGELLSRMEKLSDWDKLRKKAASSTDPRYIEGVGMGTIIYGVNLHWGGSRLDRGAAYLIILNDGSVSLSVGITDMGQGALAAMRTICAAALGIREDRIRIAEADTAMVPDSGPTVASRATMSGGNAVIDAARQLNERLAPFALELLGVTDDTKLTAEMGIYSHPDSTDTVTFEKVVERLYGERINPAAVGWYRSESREYDPETGQGQAYPFYAFGGHVVHLAIDKETGQIKIKNVFAVHDVGKIINRVGIEGQVHGGTVQGLGWATMEEFRLREGVMLNAGFTDYLIPTSLDVPESIEMDFIEEPEAQGPFGAKGIGEPSFISVGGAVLNAVAHATGKPVTSLPLTPETVFNIMKS